ncbi:Replication protein [Vibrio crassostreae]|nr:Replication protein [Vibrio crassostreae]
MIEFLDRPIAFHRPFVKLGIGITGALMLSQAIYWSRRTNESGYFYKTQAEWEDETGMTRRELDTARKKLRELGILEEKKQGVPCRIFYKINEPNLIAQLRHSSLAECAKQCSTNAPTCAAQKRQTKTETTQRLPETTNNKDHVSVVESCFDRLWATYPTKKSKKNSLAKFKSIVTAQSEPPEVFTEMLCRDVETRVANRQFGFDRLHLTTYLNQERWNDDHENTRTSQAAPKNRVEQYNAELLERYGHTATSIGRQGDSFEPRRLDPSQVCGGLRDEMAASGTTIDLDSSDYNDVGQ